MIYITGVERQFQPSGQHSEHKKFVRNRWIHNPGIPDYKKFAKERTEKEAFFRDLISEAMEKAILHQTTSTDSHFIIGSMFHCFNYANTQSRFALTKMLCNWISDEIKVIGLQSLYVTFYTGYREVLITNDVSITCYNENFLRAGPIKLSQEFKSSINNDLEDFIHEIQNGRRPAMISLEQPDILYLHKMLTKKELIQVQNLHSPFWNSIVGRTGILCVPEAPGLEAKMSYNDLKKINKPKFVFCFGKRLTILLK